MSRNKDVIVLLFCCLFHISCRFFSCPGNSEDSPTLDKTDFSLPEVDFYQKPLTPVVIVNKVLVNTQENYKQSIKDYYTDSIYCPTNFLIPKKEELDAIINDLGGKEEAYSTFTNNVGLNMEENIYYLTNTKGN